MRELRYSSTVEPFYVWKYVPRIRDIYLDCVIYLYRSEEAARAGEAAGGTGFLTLVPSQAAPGYGFLNAVTNRHVIEGSTGQGGSPVIRMNTTQGDTDIRVYRQEEWVPHPDGDDLAAVPVTGISREKLKFYGLSFQDYVSEERIEKFEIGPGDEIFTVGRFITYSGIQRNLPSVRFGNISMMPEEPIADHRGHEQKLYLVEVRSLRGSSGSPVFVYLPPMFPRPSEFDIDPEKMLMNIAMNPLGPWLLGIACADVPYKEEVKVKVVRGGVEREERTNYVAYSNSGQMAVIPAWRISDFLLNDERLKMARDAAEKRLEEAKAKSPLRPTTQEHEETAGITREDYEDALRKVFPKPSESESESDET